MSEDMPQVPNGFGLHAKRAPEVDPVARLRREQRRYQLGWLAAELVAVAPQKDKRRVSTSSKKSRAKGAYLHSEKASCQVIHCSDFKLIKTLI
ncbi:MAG: hypothetical protein C0469_00455 [Cyanobacteria bacterium DS2.3.42]|nr:hypothetical protein [Cyanobacteria bacterium DS2.3.42]